MAFTDFDLASTSPDALIIQHYVSQQTIGQYCQVAIVALLCYDALITFDKEVEFFWVKSPWFPIRILYFMNRYLGIFGASSYLISTLSGEQTISLCIFSSWTYNITNCLTIVAIDYLLMIRVLALYSQDKKLSVILGSLLFIEVVVEFALVLYGTGIEDTSMISIVKDFEVCGIKVIPPIVLIIIDWSIPLAFGVLLMILAIYKATQYWRMSHGFRAIKLLQVVIQDQAVYFAVALSICILNIIELRINTYNDVLSGALQQARNPSLLCILGSRLLFDLREAGKLGLNEGTSYRSASSDIEFGRPEADSRQFRGDEL